MKLGARSFDRYVLVGLANTALDLVLFSTLALAVGFAPVAANVISTVCVMTVSFFVNRAFVFRSSAGGLMAFVRFVSVTLFTGLVVQSAVIVAAIAASGALLPGLPEAVVTPGAKVLAMGVGMVVNFLGYRWLFSTPASTQPATGRRSPTT